MLRTLACAVACVAAQDIFLKLEAPHPPHILFLLSDDLGWSNIGFHNPLVQSTAIDNLRETGIELTRHYAFKFCSPSRSSFLSGRLPVHVNELNKITEAPMAGVHPNMTMIPAQLKKAGYATHHIGKWHAGFGSRTGHIPYARGFDTSLGYFHGAEDHYLQNVGGNVDCGGKLTDLWLNDKPAYGLNGTNYSMYLYEQRALQLLDDHDPATPFFLFLAFANSHMPLQVPDNFLAMYTDSHGKTWQTYQAMITAVDTAVANIVAKLKSKNMYENSLIVWTSDNGGPVYPGGGANNYPLRGGKISDWEGGVRVATVVSGGLVPARRRNATYEGVTHFADWYATFCALAGISSEDTRAAADGLPPVDGHDLTKALFESAASPWTHKPLLLSSHYSDPVINKDKSAVLIYDDFKLIVGKTVCPEWQAPVSPNRTSALHHMCAGDAFACGEGCLFNVAEDPGEHIDLASTHPTRLANMQDRLKQELQSVYKPDRGDPGNLPCEAALAAGGYWAPFLP